MLRQTSRRFLLGAGGIVVVGFLLIMLAATWPVAARPAQSLRIAYLFFEDKETAAAFEALLESENFLVDLIPLAETPNVDFDVYQLIIVAHDTGWVNHWGQQQTSAAYIDSFGKPVIGLGEGGYAYFGQLDRRIGWPEGTHENEKAVLGDPALPYYQTPYDLTALLGSALELYGVGNSQVSIYLSQPEPDIIPLGREVDRRGYYPLIAQRLKARCDQLWGFAGGPELMTTEGRRLFTNAVWYGLENCPISSGESTATPTPTSTSTPTPTPTSTATPSFPLIFPLPYLPTLASPDYNIPKDLSIFGIELTQAIQCFDPSKGLAACGDNSLRLAVKKGGAARIYLKYSGPLSSLPNVPVRIYFRANGVWYQANANGKAVKTLDQSKNDSADVWFKVDSSNDITVDIYAVVDPDNVIAETNESNNRFPASGYITRTFRKRDRLKIVGQRLRYHPPGYSGGQYASGWAVNGGAADYFEQILPVQDGGIDYSVKSGYLDWTTTLNPDGQHALIQTLNMMWILDQAFGGVFGGAFLGADHVYGWVTNNGFSGGHADMPVYPHAGGLGVVGIGTDRPGSSTDSPGRGALIFVHELLHDYDLKHTDTGVDDCGSDDDSSNFPYSTSGIQEFGYNPSTGNIYGPANTHDVMSYCPAGGSKQGWMSPYTWEYMSSKIDAAQVQASADRGEPVRLGAENFRFTQAQKSLVVFATIGNPDHQNYNPEEPGRLYNMHLIDGGVEYPLPGDGYAVQLRIGSKVLYQEDFAVSFESEYHSAAHRGPGQNDEPVFPSDPSPQADVQMIIPWAEGADNVALVKGDQVLAVQPVSANPPTVTIIQPTSPQIWPAGTEQKIVWKGSDPDGDPLSYSIFYTRDDDNWELLATDLQNASYIVPVDAFAGGDQARFRVVATDGVHTAMDESATVSIPDKAPFVTISEPADGRSFVPGGLVIMQGAGVDMEDGTLDESALTWSSDRQGVLGTGFSLARNDLQPGLHVITLTAEDSAGQRSQASVTIFIGHRAYLPMLTR